MIFKEKYFLLLYFFNDISVNANLISAILKSRWQRIDTITFYLRDISTPLVSVVFKHRSNIRTVNIQMLIWHHICFAMASLIAQCTFKIDFMFHSKGVHVFVLTKLPSSRFTLNLLLLHFNLMISSGSLIFLLLYLASLDNVSCFSQLNWPWHSKQCSVAPELFLFPFILSCWYSIVLVAAFFFVLPMYSALQLQFNV